MAIIDYSNFIYLPANSNNYTVSNRPYSNVIDKVSSFTSRKGRGRVL